MKFQYKMQHIEKLMGIKTYALLPAIIIFYGSMLPKGRIAKGFILQLLVMNFIIEISIYKNIDIKYWGLKK